MDDIQICPMCGARNAAGCSSCAQCAHVLPPIAQSGEVLESVPSLYMLSQDEPLPVVLRQELSFAQCQRVPTSPLGVKIVRSSSRRKFLVGLLGSGAILAMGSVGLVQLAQNLRVALNAKNYPYNFWDNLVGDSYSPDLNFMAMVKDGEENNPDAKLYIWDYQQQRMTTLSTGPEFGDNAVWSPDNRHLLFPSQQPGGQDALDLWDIQTHRKLSTYSGNDYGAFSKISWSPDGSRIGLLLTLDSSTFVVMSPLPLKPLFTFNASDSVEAFIWSPDGRKVAFLLGNSDDGVESIQIWDVQSRKMVSQMALQRMTQHGLSDAAWSPDGARIAILANGQLQIIQVGSSLSSYILDEPNDGGKLAWSPDSKHLAVAVSLPTSLFISFGGKFSVWDVVERKRIRVLRSDSSTSEVPDAMTWSKDGVSIRVIADLYQQENWNWQ